MARKGPRPHRTTESSASGTRGESRVPAWPIFGSANQTRWAALIVLITVAAYIPAFRAGYIWDDDAHITQNEPLRTVAGIGTIWTSPTSLPQYYPLVHSTYWLEYRLWGLDPAGYHVVNMLLHALAAILLWTALARLALPGAWLAGAVFAIHPVQVESVAWITERKNVLCAVFYLAALLCFLRFQGLEERGAGNKPRASREAEAEIPAKRDGGDDSLAIREGEDAAPARRDRGAYALGCVFFLLALLSKTVAFSLPAAVLLIVWWKRGRISWRDARPQIPPLVVGGVFGLLTAYLEKHHVGAVGAEWSLTAVQRVLVAGWALWFYAGKLIVPWPLAFVYPRWSVDAGEIVPYLFPAAFLAVAAALLFLAPRIGRGPAAAVLFFAGTLVPALGFFDVYPMRYAYVADHFQYLASMGLIALACGLAAAWAARARPGGRPPDSLEGERGRGGGRGDQTIRSASPDAPPAPSPPWARAVAAAILVALGILTWRQSLAYHDAETLWRDTIAKNPDAWMARDNLGLLLAARGETDAAITQFREAVRINPHEASLRSNLGIALAAKGDAAGAVEELSRALEIDPDLVEVRYNLGTALLRTGDFSSAVAAFEEVVRRSPRYAQAHNNLAMALRRVGREDEAIAHYRQALAIDPHLAAASFNLAAALDARGRLEEAAVAYAEFLELQPRDAEAESRYADVLTDLGRAEEAALHAQRARELSGGATPPASSAAP